MAVTLNRKADLEAEIIGRCVRALQLRGKADHNSRYTRQLETRHIARVLRYLGERFGCAQ